MKELEQLNQMEEVEGYSIKDAIAEAKRCLQCPKPQCRKGCPIEHHIPEFIAAIGKGNMGEALSIISARSNLPAVCGRVCPHELQCEGHCILNKKGERIRVGLLERFVADFDFAMRLTQADIPAKTRGKVAVLGSGPAGLTVAGDLAKLGFHVSVYETAPEPGGVLLYGIPAFRLPRNVVRREILRIEQQGVNFYTNITVGNEITIDQLFEEGFDAIFIGTGTAISKDLDIPGKHMIGVMQSSYLLRMVSLFESHQVEREQVPVDPGDQVLVLGGGNVAVDTARSAIRLGADKVTVVYYNTPEKMSALETEYEAAVEDGVNFLFEANSLQYIGEDNRLRGLEVETPEGERTLSADKVFLAVGSRPADRIVSTTKGIDVDNRGYVITKERPYGMTTRKGVFAGGDVVHQPATVVLAMKEAKRVAEGIANYVDAIQLLNL